MNEKLSENYSHHKKSKIPRQLFVLLSKTKYMSILHQIILLYIIFGLLKSEYLKKWHEMNEKLSENYNHHKKSKIPWQLFVLLSKKHICPFYPRLWGKMDINIFVLIKFLVPLNDIKNSKCIGHSRGIYTNVKDFSPKFPNIYIYGFYLRWKSKIVPFYPGALYSA